jgi:general secretion pathway protein H
LSDPSPGARVKTAAHQLVAALREARSEAILRNTETTLPLDVERRAFRTGPRSQLKALPSDIELALTIADTERVDAGAANIRFFPDGSSTGGRIVLSKGASSYEVTVPWLTGRARVDEPPASR